MIVSMWRKLLGGLRALMYLGVLGLLFVIAAYLAFSQFIRGGGTAAPDLYGLAEEDARALLVDQGLDLAWEDTPRFDENVPQGHVMAQRPRAGTLIKRGATVTAVPSRGPQRIEVPSLDGDALQAAQVTLAAAGLTVGHTLGVFDEDGRDGIVTAQRPDPSSLLEPSAPVDLFLSMRSTAQSYLMPDLVRRDYNDVRRFFERRGFRLGRVAYLTYGGVAPGTVVRQFPPAGHPLRRGDVIALGVVSPQETVSP